MSVRLREFIKSLLLILLFAAMVALAAVYIAQTRMLTIGSEADITADNLLILRGGDISASGELEKTRVLPQYIAYKLGGDDVEESSAASARAVMGSRDIISDLYFSLTEYISPYMSSSAVCEPVATDWSTLYDRDCYVAIHYASELPAPVVLMYMTADTMMDSSRFASGENVYISDIMLVMQNNAGSSTLEVYSRTSSGDVFKYIPDGLSAQLAEFPLETLTEYNRSTEFVAFTPASESSADNSVTLTPTTLLTSSTVSSKLINVTNTLDVTLETDSASLLRLFDFNPDRINRYSETENGETLTVYVESFGNLQFRSGGNITFTASADIKDGAMSGIPVSDYLGYSNYSGEYSLSELIRSAEAFITSFGDISTALTGGDSDISLYDVYTENGEVIIEYIYTFDNIRLYSSDGSSLTALRFRIRGGNIVGIDINSLTVKNKITRRRCYSQRFMLTNIALLLSEQSAGAESVAENIPAQPTGECKLGYILTQGSGDIGAEWIFDAVRVSSGGDKR